MGVSIAFMTHPLAQSVEDNPFPKTLNEPTATQSPLPKEGAGNFFSPPADPKLGIPFSRQMRPWVDFSNGMTQQFKAPQTGSSGGAFKSSLILSAALEGSKEPISSGLTWRVFAAQTQYETKRDLVAQSTDAAPFFNLPAGDYIIHAAYGLASAIKPLRLGLEGATAALFINAGGLRVKATLGNKAIAQNRLKISLFIPEPGNLEARLVAPDIHSDEIVYLPEGNYHLESTYLEATGENRESNSQVSADLHITNGKLLDLTVRHRAGSVTLKLVNTEGGEALADTYFTVLTPGGDIIREAAGAFPTLSLAEGEYLIVARHGGKTYQSNFKVETAIDSDVEIVTQSQETPQNPDAQAPSETERQKRP